MNNLFAAISPILFAGSGHGGHEEKHGLKELIFHHIFDSKEGEGFYYPLFKLFGVEIAITKHVLVMWIVAALLVLVGFLVAKAVKRDKTATGGRLSILVQIFIEFIQNDILKPNFHHGDEYKKWTPYFVTLFFYILFSNFIGMVPFSATITGNIAVTMTLAVLTFLITQIYGMSKRGVVHYWVGLVPEGVPKALWPMLFVIEFAGLFTKPFALTLRLFANMIAGHIVILVFLYFAAESANSLIGLGVAPLATTAAIAVNVLEVLICVLQAYIFTFLSAIFVASAGESH